MRLTPIFDTNIFGHLRDGSISQKDWRYVLRHRPGHGWPLSAVTALELLAGFQEVHSEKFLEQKAQVELALQVSKGRIWQEPRFLICKDVLRIPFPAAIPIIPVALIADHLHVVRCAHSLADILKGRVKVNRLLTKGQGHAGLSGFQTSLIQELVAGPKRSWKEAIENLASENYPRWREHFEETGERLPDELRKDLQGRLELEAERMKFVEGILRWLGANTEPELVMEIAKRLDAVLAFTTYVLREFLTREYKLEKHESDVYDQFQLHYLVMNRFALVSEDRALLTRTTGSSQANRIISFETFLRSL